MLKTEQKQEVLRLRKEGYGYKSIASILNISRDAVRNLCKKHNLTGYGAQSQEIDGIKEDAPTHCLNCKNEINNISRRGRKSKFCCEKCRRTWWSNNDHKKNKKAWYDFTCKNCGKEFRAYGNKNRIFCSVKCSTEYRFGSTTQDEKVFF